MFGGVVQGELTLWNLEELSLSFMGYSEILGILPLPGCPS